MRVTHKEKTMTTYKFRLTDETNPTEMLDRLEWLDKEMVHHLRQGAFTLLIDARRVDEFDARFPDEDWTEEDDDGPGDEAPASPAEDEFANALGWESFAEMLDDEGGCYHLGHDGEKVWISGKSIATAVIHHFGERIR